MSNHLGRVALRALEESRRRRRPSWRFASTLLVSLAVHGASAVALLSGVPHGDPQADLVFVELVGAGTPAARSDAAGTIPDIPAPVAGALPAPWEAAAPPAPATEDRVAALVAERDELATRLDAATVAQAELGEHVAALAAEKLALTSELAEERQRADRLEQSLAERRAEAEVAVRETRETYDALVAALRDEISEKDVALRRAREGLTVSIVDRVLFPSGEAALTPEGGAVIDKVARVLATTVAGRIVIEGHTDNVPIGPELRARFPSNWELSTARATEVVRRLVERGLPPQALEAVGRADTRPVASNHTEDGRRHNRRIAIILPGATSPPGAAEPGGS
jgi:chemotaxis protein MotB